MLCIIVSGLLQPATAQQQAKDCHDRLLIQVLEEKTNLPVAGAAIAAGEQQTLTDADGMGLLENVCPGKVQLHVESVGYLRWEKEVTFTAGDTLKCLLRSDNMTLDAIEVLGHKQVLNTTTSVTTLHQEDLDRLKGGNLATMLTAIPGVSMLQTGATIGKPVVNGMHSNRLLILNNGIRQEGQQWGSEHAPEIDPFIAQNISVVKGAEAIRYGAEAIGGVVIVEPPALPSDAALHAELNLVGASNGKGGTASGMLSGNFKKIPELAWRVQGTAKRSGNLQTADYYLDNTGAKEMNYSAALGYNKEHMGLDLFYSHFNTTLGIFKESHIGSEEDLISHIANGRPFDNGSFYYGIDAPKQQIRHNLFKANGHIHLSDYVHVNMLYGFQTDNRQEYDVRRGGRSGIPSLNLTLLTHTLDASMEYYNGRQWKATLGVNGLLQQNSYDATSATLQPIPYYNTEGGGVYAIGKLIKDAYQLEAGLRYDYKFLTASGYRGDTLYGGRHTFHNVSASLGIVVPVKSNFNFRSNIGSAWRPPTANELYSAGLHSSAAAVEFGDSTLNSEKSIKWINTIDYAPFQWLKVNVDLYANYFSNYIYLSPTGQFQERLNGTFPVFQQLHTNARFLGADVSMSIHFLQQFDYSLKASFIRAKDLTQDQYLPNIPADRIEHALKWQPAVALNFVHGTYVQFGHVFVARQTRYNTGSDFAPPPAAYHLLNLNAGTQFRLNKHNLGVNVSVDNLANTLYKDYMNRFRYYADDIGRNVVLRLTYRI